MSFALFFQYNASPSILPLVAMATVAGTGTLLYFRYWRERSDALRKLASKRGLRWLPNTLPGDFPRKLLDDLYCGWVMPRWTRPHNMIGGEAGTDFLLAFDITVAKGDTSYRRTIVARRSATATPKSSLGKGYLYRCAGEWQLATPESSVFANSRLIDPGTIEKLWEQLR